MRFLRGFLTRLAFALCLTACVSSPNAFAQTAVPASSIAVEGNRRVDADTIRTYFKGTDEGKINDAVRSLYATGLFSDVRVSRDGGRIIVHVAENGVINRVAFEGNKKVKSEQLETELSSKTRGPLFGVARRRRRAAHRGDLSPLRQWERQGDDPHGRPA